MCPSSTFGARSIARAPPTEGDPRRGRSPAGDDDQRSQIGGLEPDRYTRTGAAIRHATAELAEQSAHYPLLLVLSDGKPNDVDQYEHRYGIEDTARAVHEAHMQGLAMFCLTIDREAPSYMDRIFEPSTYAVINQPDRLPRVLVKVIRQLIDR